MIRFQCRTCAKPTERRCAACQLAFCSVACDAPHVCDALKRAALLIIQSQTEPRAELLLYQEAVQYFRVGAIDAALMLAREGLRTPSRWDFCALVSQLYLKQNDPEAAMNILQERNKAFPTPTPAQKLRGAVDVARVLFHQKQVSSALALIEAAALEAEDGEALGEAGDFLYLEKKPRAALAVYERAARFAKDRARALNKVADLLLSFNELNRCRALQAEVLEILKRTHGPEHPMIAFAMHNIARRKRAEGREAQAIKRGRLAAAMLSRLLGEHHEDTERVRAFWS